ncbi:MAG: ABC transporter permease [Prevotellaceae bacterium]|jgi:lipoprotein-releasing system permease protein|nr:ABC transporter permease [Prevotellaceae bacterium]
MSFSFYIAQRLYRQGDMKRRASRPAVLIAMIGIAVGLAVMIITLAVIIGFKKEVRDKVSGFSAHIQIVNLEAAGSYEMLPVVIDDSLLRVFAGYPEVKHVQRFSTKPGMIKTENDFQGMVLKGVGAEYDVSFFQKHLLEGEIPSFSDSIASGRILISRTLADKLHVALGDTLTTYYIQKNIRARKLIIAGIYRTNFVEYDNLFLLTDIALVGRLNNWQRGQVSGAELRVDYNRLEEDTWEIASRLETMQDPYNQHYCALNIEQLNPQLFAWLNVLDVNIWVILFLMLGVAGFTMVSGLLIIIIERTSMIGVLKSLGADSGLIRRVFLWFSVFLIGKGMIWGNVVGLVFYFVQSRFGLFSLNPETYYTDTVPVSFSFLLFVVLNVGTLLASVLMMVVPSYLITRIRPANSMRYE